MRLTVYTDYALRVLMYVALRDGELVRVAEIASGFGISHNHLTKVVHNLGAAGFLRTVRGRSGGIELKRQAEDITVGEVVRTFEPDFRMVECFGTGESICRIQPACVLKGVFGNALEAFFDCLEQVTLADLVGPRRRLKPLLGVSG